uniref:Putative glutamate receptor-like protein n=1 Tax=Ixodes scapularis TaxID=6945 RepID=A0A4D5S1V6_IXOSC
MIIMALLLTLDLCLAKADTATLGRRFGNSLWLCCTYFFTSVSPTKQSNIHRRILLGSWSLFLFFLVALLSSRLVSTMLVKSTEDHVDQLHDVLRFPKLKILVERKTGFEWFLMKPKTEMFLRLQRLVEPVAGAIFPGAKQDEVFDRVERGGHVVLFDRYFHDATLARRFAQRGHCSFRMARQSLYLQPVSMLIRRTLDPRLKTVIKALCRRMYEMALYQRPMEPFIFNATKCYQEEPEEAFAFRLDNLQGAFLSLLIGLVLSCVALVAEMIAPAAHSRRRHHRVRAQKVTIRTFPPSPS